MGNMNQPELTNHLQDNLKQILKDLGGSSDLIVREFRIARIGGIKAALVYIDGMVDNQLISNFIMDALMSNTNPGFFISSPANNQPPISFMRIIGFPFFFTICVIIPFLLLITAKIRKLS